MELGAPLPGLSLEELARFREGESLFNRVFTPEEGVGPLFNENQCSACHTDPSSGGTGEQLLLKATRFTHAHGCDLLRSEGGENVRQQATPLLRAYGVEQEPVPSSATERGRFTVPFLFGLGLVEAIPEESILASESRTGGDGGISGRAGRDAQGRVGRFGRKSDVATLLDFVDSALRFEMGMTTPLDPRERGIRGEPLPAGTDPAPDPEIDQRTLELLTDYVRFLAPPSRRPAAEADRWEVAEGERLFEGIGCASCHVPSMRTGPSEIAPLDRTVVYLYSDLLLHDMGPALASVCGSTATPAEIRTEMLMGIGHRRRFLHDGRAGSLLDAILQHGGEAARARAAFAALNRVAQEHLIMFLRTL